jgi:hypothetical protein
MLISFLVMLAVPLYELWGTGRPLMAREAND